MDIMELGAIGELVGGVAVIATLIYLAVQVRQNALETRVASSQALTDSINQVNLVVSADPGRASITRRGREDYSSLNDDERTCFDHELYSLCHIWETILRREILGIADPETTNSARKTAREFFVGFPGVRAWWAQNRFAFNAEFTALVDEWIGNRPPEGA